MKPTAANGTAGKGKPKAAKAKRAPLSAEQRKRIYAHKAPEAETKQQQSRDFQFKMRRLYKTMVKHEGKSLETPEYYKEILNSKNEEEEVPRRGKRKSAENEGDSEGGRKRVKTGGSDAGKPADQDDAEAAEDSHGDVAKADAAQNPRQKGKKANPILDAYQARKAQARQAQIERQRREEEIEEKRQRAEASQAARNARRKQVLQKNRRGQPILNNQIGSILDKLLKEKQA